MLAIQNRILTGMKFIDLFAGIGGFRLALESLGATCVYSSEWDKYAQQTYAANFGVRPDGDITKVDATDVPDHDILCAGFPCQAFSISGKQLGFEDSRGTLFFDVARIVQAKRPKVVFMENVRNFASHDGGRTLDVVRSTMENLGYDFSYRVLNAADYGVPQKRERVYMVCFRKDMNVRSFEYPHPIGSTRCVEDVLLDDSATEYLYVNRSDITYFPAPVNRGASKPLRVGVVGKGGQGERIYSIKGVGITLSAYGGGVFAKTGGYLVNGRSRKLHPRECARLMGYPDSYIIHPSAGQAYKQFGNSVVVDVLQYVAIAIGTAMH